MDIYERGLDYADFRPDRVAMQDATAQMALLQFMMATRRKKVAVPSTVHADHLNQLKKTGSDQDLSFTLDVNSEVYDFLSSVSNKYGDWILEARCWNNPPRCIGKLQPFLAA